MQVIGATVSLILIWFNNYINVDYCSWGKMMLG